MAYRFENNTQGVRSLFLDRWPDIIDSAVVAGQHSMHNTSGMPVYLPTTDTVTNNVIWGLHRHSNVWPDREDVAGFHIARLDDLGITAIYCPKVSLFYTLQIEGVMLLVNENRSHAYGGRLLLFNHNVVSSINRYILSSIVWNTSTPFSPDHTVPRPNGFVSHVNTILAQTFPNGQRISDFLIGRPVATSPSEVKVEFEKIMKALFGDTVAKKILEKL